MHIRIFLYSKSTFNYSYLIVRYLYSTNSGIRNIFNISQRHKQYVIYIKTIFYYLEHKNTIV